MMRSCLSIYHLVLWSIVLHNSQWIAFPVDFDSYIYLILNADKTSFSSTLHIVCHCRLSCMMPGEIVVNILLFWSNCLILRIV